MSNSYELTCVLISLLFADEARRGVSIDLSSSEQFRQEDW